MKNSQISNISTFLLFIFSFMGSTAYGSTLMKVYLTCGSDDLRSRNTAHIVVRDRKSVV